MSEATPKTSTPTSGQPHALHTEAAHRYAGLHAVLFTTVMLALSAMSFSRVDSYKVLADKKLIEGQLARDFEAHYDDHFPAKTLGVNLWAAIDYKLFNEGRAGVVLGRHGWLYTDEEFAIENDTDAVIQANLALLNWVHRQLEAKHIQLVLALVPAKARIYPEHLDTRQPPAAQSRMYTTALTAIRREGIPLAALFSPLASSKASGPMFLTTDTHWTAAGAAVAARTVAETVRAAALIPDGSSAFVTHDEAPQMHRGDLLNYLPLDPWFAGLLPAAESIVPQVTESTSSGNDLLSESGTPEIALIGTSYSANPLWNFPGALKQALKQDVLNYAKDGKGPFAPMLDYLRGEDIKTAPPRLVIWEVPERYLLARQDLAAYALPSEVYPEFALMPHVKR